MRKNILSVILVATVCMTGCTGLSHCKCDGVSSGNAMIRYAHEKVDHSTATYIPLNEGIGKEKYNGLSAGQSCLQRKKDEFYDKGYLHINGIAKYAYKKHPDYPIKYF